MLLLKRFFGYSFGIFFTCYYVGSTWICQVWPWKSWFYTSSLGWVPCWVKVSGLEICKAQQSAVFSHYLSMKTWTRSVPAPPERLTMVFPCFLCAMCCQMQGALDFLPPCCACLLKERTAFSEGSHKQTCEYIQTSLLVSHSNEGDELLLTELQMNVCNVMCFKGPDLSMRAFSLPVTCPWHAVIASSMSTTLGPHSC